jgi:hypothetical protein
MLRLALLLALVTLTCWFAGKATRAALVGQAECWRPGMARLPGTAEVCTERGRWMRLGGAP